MSEVRTTSELILEAALRSIRTRGRESLTMSAVAAEAGVSRPTLYRWFPTKALLLGAITAYLVERFDLDLQNLADTHADPRARFDAALVFIVTSLDESIGQDSISADPAFALQSLADSLVPHVESIARVLGDALDEIPTVREAFLTREQGAEMLLRVAYSHYLVPNADPERLVETLRVFAGLQPRPVRRRPAR